MHNIVNPPRGPSGGESDKTIENGSLVTSMSYTGSQIAPEIELKVVDFMLSDPTETIPNNHSVRGWFLAPAEFRTLLTIAIPLMISTGFFSLQLFIDRTMLYAYSDAAAAAALGAGSIYWTLTCFPVGLIGFVYAFVAQYFGAQQNDRIGRVLWQAIWLALFTIPVFIGIFFLSDWIFEVADHPPEVALEESRYFRWLVVGGTGAVLTSALSGLFSGLGHTRVVMYSDFLATVVNLTLDYCLIFGVGPFPEMGIAGAAIATSIATWIHVPIFIFAIWKTGMIDKYGLLRGMVWDNKLIRRFIRFGWPAGVQMLSESAAFSVIMWKVGQIGALELAATTLALGVNILAFIPMIGLSMAIGIIVGQRLTENRTDLAVKTVRTGLLISTVYTGLFAFAYFVFPDQILSFYGAFTEEKRFAEVLPLVRPLLFFIALYCIFDGYQIILVGAIKGAGDTLFVLFSTIFTSLLATGVGFVGANYFGSSLFWWWGVITFWVLSMMIAFSLRYLQGSWKTMRVIEKELLIVEPD